MRREFCPDDSFTVRREVNHQSGQLGFPEFGNWKSFEEIKDALAKEIEKQYPAKAFPFLRLGKITLYRRNEDDKEYLWDMGDFDVEDIAND